MLQFSTFKILIIAALCVLGAALAAPNLVSRETAESLPSWIPHKQINLGLDLQGGSHLLMEVDTKSVVKDTLNTLVDDVRTELRKADIGYLNLGTQGDAVAFKLTDPARSDDVSAIIRKLNSQLDITADNGQFTLKLNEQGLRDLAKRTIDQSIEILNRRVDETGTREATIQREGEDRILIQLPGVKDPEHVKEILGKTAKLTFHLVDPTVSPEDAQGGHVPPGDVVLPGADAKNGRGGQPFYVVEKRVVVSGERLTDAQASFDQGRPDVSFRFDTVGGKKFGDATRDNVNRQLAIVLDDKVISAPRINEPILGGSGIITGQFTTEETNDLALLLRAGALPAPLSVLEERSVGPSLGEDSIRAGKIAAGVGFVLVVGFMALVYGFFGLIADIALLLNLILLLGALSLLQATLTLPGIAGIVLTMGMAVDANVLIYERIREEVHAGRTPFSAISTGFERAFATIIDSNLTTFIAGAMLYVFGSGPVKGFAVTLTLGLITTLFTAVMVTRLMVATWLRRARPKALPV